MISRLHYITQEIAGKTHSWLAEEACAGGADWIQLRVKNRSHEEWKAIALETLVVCKKYNAKLIINDNVGLAKEIGAEGVHLGKQDMSPAEARRILGGNFIIGGTANAFEDIQSLAKAGVDYIGLGPFRFTSTKEKLSPVLGLEGYSAIMQQCNNLQITIPVIAIGGIIPGDVPGIMEAGIYGVAVAGYINHAERKKEVIEEYRSNLESKKIKTR